MNRKNLIDRVRSLTRDFSGSIFRNVDVTDYINESIDRFRQRVPELQSMTDLTSDDMSPTLLPTQYHSMIALYSASKCFFQDERHYQAGTLMNEFETKLEELISDIAEGKVVIKDSNGAIVITTYESDYVRDVYFNTGSSDSDDGVDGVS
jgi:hypothetical protein